MKRYLFILFSILIFCTFLFSSYTKEHKQNISLFIPEEMHFVIPELVKIYQKEHHNIEFLIQEVSSNEFSSLPKEGIHIIDSWNGNSVEAFLSSPLVLIGHRKIYSLDQLKGSSITIADPDYSVTGVNSIRILREDKLWDHLKRAISYRKKGILCMESVDLREEDYAIISLADSVFIKNAFIVFSLENRKEFSIQYRIKNYDKKNETQTQFYEFLRSEKAMKIFRNYGFIPMRSANLTKSAKQT